MSRLQWALFAAAILLTVARYHEVNVILDTTHSPTRRGIGRGRQEQRDRRQS